ncbi:MAG: hypothetical protein Tsb0021_05120 [Chlamydiales bacterium]
MDDQYYKENFDNQIVEQGEIPPFLLSGAMATTSDGNLLLGWGKVRSSAFCENNQDRSTFYFSDYFFKEKAPWKVFEFSQICTMEKMMNWLNALTWKNKERLVRNWCLTNMELYHQAFSELKDNLLGIKLKKAVPYLFAKAQSHYTYYERCLSFRSLLNYAMKYPVFLYGYWDANKGILGATPETLFSYRDSQLDTHAIAGTCKIEKDQDLFLNQKLMEEHQIVVQDITERLSGFGKVTVGQLQKFSLKSMSHLKTPIQLYPSQALNFEKLVRCLHPTPALGAYPRDLGWKWLESYQKKIPRAYFGAPVGYFDPKNNTSQCYVAIRNVQWSKSSMYIGAGGGITADSNIDQELEEINMKISEIRNVLEI